jgi:NAD(P) transhydrogenase
MDRRSYDLVVIGAGPAGEKGAAQAAYFGKRVAIVEQGELGGAGCNTGTLPSKTLRETALVLSGLRARDLYGVDLSLRRDATVKDFLTHERHVASAERLAVHQNIGRHGIDLYHGAGSFEDAGTVRVDAAGSAPVYLSGEKILIAAGSTPIHPPMFHFEDRRIWDSDEIVQMEFMPKRMAVIGAGIIGCEYACTFAALGIQVTLVNSREELLPFLDGDVREILERQMQRLGVRVLPQARVASCEAESERVLLSLEAGDEVDVDAVLVAVGRRGNVEELGLERAGVEVNEWGSIPVNEHYQTSVPHIYAAGDIVGFPALASTSMEQARLAMVHAFDLKYKTTVGPVLPMGIFTIPEIGIAGENEEQLRDKGVPYVVGRASYAGNARGRIVGDTEGMLKLIFHADDMRLLGVSVIGEGATELVHIGLMALMAEGRSDIFIDACFNYPTLGQLYKYATYDAMGNRGGGTGSAK